MKTFEVVTQNLLSEKANVIKILVGCFIGLFPIINIACLGYLLQSAKQNDPLPQWEITKKSIKQLYLDGLRGLLLFVLFYVMPVVLGYFTGKCFSWIGEGFVPLGTCVGMMVGAQLTTIALMHNEQITKSNIWNVIMKISKMTLQSTSVFLFPSLLFVGLQLAGASILGYIGLGTTLFLGLMLIVVYAKQALSVEE